MPILSVAEVLGGEHQQHALGLLGLGGVDLLDARMAVRRHDDNAIGLLRQGDVVDDSGRAR